MEFRYIKEKKDLVKLCNLIKSDNDSFGCKLPCRLEPNEYIISIIDDSEIKLNIKSFIWFGIYENEEIGKYLNTNFSYTFKAHRANGLNKFLRLKLEEFAISNGINKITSIPLDKSLSAEIILRLGYKFNGSFYIKEI